MIDWIRGNIEICALMISTFSVIMLIWSNFEIIKSRRLQYLPFLRLGSDIGSINMVDNKSQVDEEKVDVSQIANSYFKLNQNSEDCFILHNEGVGIAKDIKVVIDLREIISTFEKINNKISRCEDDNELYYLKPFFDVYEIKSFHFPIYECVNMTNSILSLVKNSISQTFSDLVYKTFNKRIPVKMHMKDSLLYLKYTEQIIKTNSEFHIPLGTLFKTIQLAHLVYGDDRIMKHRIPLYLEFRDLENRIHKEYYNIKWECYMNRFSQLMSNEDYYNIINGLVKIEDLFTEFNHSTENSSELKLISKVKGKFKFMKFRLRGII